MNIADRQIEREILGQIVVEIRFTDTHLDFLSIYDQFDGYYIQPAYCEPKKIPKRVYDDLKSKFTNEQEYNTDPEIIDSGMKYNEFYDKYYNHQ